MSILKNPGDVLKATALSALLSAFALAGTASAQSTQSENWELSQKFGNRAELRKCLKDTEYNAVEPDTKIGCITGFNTETSETRKQAFVCAPVIQKENGYLTSAFIAWVDYTFYHGGEKTRSTIWKLSLPKEQRAQHIRPSFSNLNPIAEQAKHMDTLSPIEQQKYLYKKLITNHGSAKPILDSALENCRS